MFTDPGPMLWAESLEPVCAAEAILLKIKSQNERRDKKQQKVKAEDS